MQGFFVMALAALKLNNFVFSVVNFINLAYNKNVIIKHKTPIKM